MKAPLALLPLLLLTGCTPRIEVADAKRADHHQYERKN